MKKIWRSNEEESINKNLPLPDANLPPIIKRFLLAREITEKNDVENLFSSKLNEIADPNLILNMDVAVERIFNSFKKNEYICIYADFDLDGTSGLALLYDGLVKLGFNNVSYYQPKRLSEGYGFHASVVEELTKKNVKLIITVDVGITAIEACEVACKNNLDVIITDHHQPKENLPKAFTIINPNQKLDQSGLGYLSGAGVAFYLLRALKRKFYNSGIENEKNLDLKSVLDFFTIATLTDMVPIVKDNRLLVKHGLQQLSITERPGLKALLTELDLMDRPLSAQDVAIKFAPKLNALSRMENGILPIDIFLCPNSETANQLMSAVLENNNDRVEFQQEGEKEAKDILNLWTNTEFIFVSSKKFHRGVIGLIATKLSQEYNIPAFVASETEDGSLVGSARSPRSQTTSVLDALTSVSAGLNRFGGHHAAAGFELYKENEEKVIGLFAEYFKSLKSENKEIVLDYDLEINEEDVSENLLKWLDAIGPFGVGFTQPQFVLRNQKILGLFKLKEIHLKLSFSGYQGLFFSVPDDFIWPEKGDLVDILGEIQWNYFAGKKSIQFIIKDLKFSENLMQKSFLESSL